MKIEANKTEYKAEERKGLVGAEKNSRSSLSSRFLRLYALTLALFLLSIFIIYLLLSTGASFRRELNCFFWGCYFFVF